MESSYLPDAAAIVRTVAALRARNIDVIVADTRAAAHHALIQLLPDGAEICDSTSTGRPSRRSASRLLSAAIHAIPTSTMSTKPSRIWPDGMTYAVAPRSLTILLAVCKPLPKQARSSWRVRLEANLPRMSMLPGASFWWSVRRKSCQHLTRPCSGCAGTPWSDMTSGWQRWGGRLHPLASWVLLNMKARRDG